MNINTFGNVVQLLRASREGNLGRVQDLLAQGVDPNAQHGTRHGAGYSPLMEAAVAGQEEVVAFLLGHPAIDLEARDLWGWTALIGVEQTWQNRPRHGRQ